MYASFDTCKGLNFYKEYEEVPSDGQISRGVHLLKYQANGDSDDMQFMLDTDALISTTCLGMSNSPNALRAVRLKVTGTDSITGKATLCLETKQLDGSSSAWSKADIGSLMGPLFDKCILAY